MVWIENIEQWFSHRHMLLGDPFTEIQRIIIAAAALEGDAKAWYLSISRDPELFNQSGLFLRGWDVFAKLLTNTFSDLRTQEQRRLRFDSLKQKKDALAFYNAIQRYRRWLEPPPTDLDCLRTFKYGLRPDILARIDILPDEQQPRDFLQYVLYASKMERQLELNHKNPKTGRGLLAATWGQPNRWDARDHRESRKESRRDSQAESSVARDESGDVIMTYMPSKGSKTFSKSIGKNSKTEQSPEFLADCRARRACFKCGEEGHMARDCTRTTSKQDSSRDKSGRFRRGASRGKGQRR